MEHCDGEIRAEGPKLCNGGDGDGSVDRLSALPDDILIHILLKLHDAAVAARTSVLSSRWRRLWTLLPQLGFLSPTDSHGIRAALESHEAPALHRLEVIVMDATPESVEVWLPIAARRLSGILLLINLARQNETEDEDEDEDEEGGALELPCFENATSIFLALRYLGLTLPPLGVFAGLTDLLLSCIKLHDPCMLGDVVSSGRCPVLQILTVDNVRGLRDFSIHSDSLLEIELDHVDGLQHLTVIAPALKLLDVTACFLEGFSYSEPVANISAPQLVSLFWKDVYDSRFTQFGKMENLECLGTHGFVVYGIVGSDEQLHNSYCTGILQRWSRIQHLRVRLLFGRKDITNREYLMEDITRLPKVINLTLDIMAKGHSCGPCLYHVLRMCTGIRKLYLTLVDEIFCPEAKTACPSGCVCDQPPNWKTDEFALDCLQEVKVSKLRGTENEAGLVKRLFDWATALETMTVTFSWFVPESKAREFCQMVQSFSRPGICLKGPHFT